MRAAPRIYVASLSDYNAGRLVGRWIDADQAAEEIHEEIRAMLEESPEPVAEEWAIHDFENFGGLSLSEYESIEHVAELAAMISEHGPAFAAYVAHVGTEYATAEEFEDSYCGEWASEEEYAENLAEEIGAIPQEFSWPASYIDWERAARDLFIGDYYSAEASAGVYVFRR